MKRVLVIIGTRPEAIKLAPVIRALEQPIVCTTGQHPVKDVLAWFDIVPDIELDAMMGGQELWSLAARLCYLLGPTISNIKPDIVMVQGDTESALAGALCAYRQKIPIAHIEAGLRTYNIYEPWPEEGIRQSIARVARYHFAPTQISQGNLASEGVSGVIQWVGNTVVDAAQWVDRNVDGCLPPGVDVTKQLVLTTLHRRENQGGGIERACGVIRQIALRGDVQFILPVHPNPQASEPVLRILGDAPGVLLVEPLSYPDLVCTIQRCYFVLTDSGGLQEESAVFHKPCVVMRNVTERMEYVEAGGAMLVGTDPEKIHEACSWLLNDAKLHAQMCTAKNPFGDGTAAEKIAEALCG